MTRCEIYREMKASIKLMTSEKKSNDGYPVKLEITHKYSRKRKKIGISQLEHWNEVEQMPKKSHPQFLKFYAKLHQLKGNIHVLEYEKFDSIEDAMNFVLGISQVTLAKVLDATLYDFVQNVLIPKLDQLNQYAMMERYAMMSRIINRFHPQLKLKSIDKKFVNDFKEHLLVNGKTKSTIKSYMSSLRAIYNKAVTLRYVEDKKPFQGQMNGLAVRSWSSKKKYILKEDVHLLEKAQLRGSKALARDLWLLQFYLGGQDLIDVLSIDRQTIYNERVFFRRSKVDGSEYDLRVFEKAQNIINKHQNLFNGFDQTFSTRENYKTFRRRLQKKLTLVQDELNLDIQPTGNGKLGIKVARHTFGTWGKRYFIEEDLLRELMAHERNDVDNYYKDRFPEEVRDEAHWKIIDTSEFD